MQTYQACCAMVHDYAVSVAYYTIMLLLPLSHLCFVRLAEEMTRKPQGARRLVARFGGPGTHPVHIRTAM